MYLQNAISYIKGSKCMSSSMVPQSAMHTYACLQAGAVGMLTVKVLPSGELSTVMSPP